MSTKLYETKPHLIKLFIYSSLKIIFVVALVAGIIAFANALIDFDLMKETFESIGLSLPSFENATIYLNLGIAIILFLYLIYNYFNIGNIKLVFFDDKIEYYKKGALVTKKTEILYQNISNVNIEVSKLFNSGDLIFELTGQKQKSMKVKFIDNTEQVCKYAQSLVDRHKAAYYQQLRT